MRADDGRSLAKLLRVDDGCLSSPDEECAPYPASKDDALDSAWRLAVEQLVQIVGAVLVLVGFTLAQLGRVDHQSRDYLIVNLVGSLMLAIDAVIGRQFGFLLLEGVWALVSGWSLIRQIAAPYQRRPRGDVKQPGSREIGLVEDGGRQ